MNNAYRKKTKRALLCMLIIAIAFSSCEKSKNNPPEDIRIKNITTSFSFSDVIVEEKFIYDNQERIIEIKEISADWTGSTYFEYTDSVIYMEVPTMLPRTDKLYLNENGLVIRVNDGDMAKTCTYDAAGFLEIEGYSSDDNNITEYYYEIDYPGDDMKDVFHYEYTYYEEQNTIYYNDELEYYNGNDNIGISFWGKQNKNLLKNITMLPEGEILKEFTYKFDSYNRVSEMKISYGDRTETKIFEYFE